MKTETYAVGDKVRKTAACAKRYPSWNIEEGEIVSLDMHLVYDKDLSSEDRVKFRERYTLQSCYPVFDMMIEYYDPALNNKRLYRTTQFDFNKD